MIAIPKSKELVVYRWEGCPLSKKLICEKEPSLKTEYCYADSNHVYCWIILTEVGSQEVKIGDVIIKTSEGCFQLCSYTTFKELFDIKETMHV